MSIVRNSIKIASTGVFVQLISFLFYPIIGRFYPPEEFGLFAFFSSCVLICSVFVTGQFYYAVTNPKEDEEANQLLSLSIWAVTIFSIIAFFILLFFTFVLGLDLTWLFLPPYLLGYSFFECFKLMAVRAKNYNHLNFSQVINRVGSNVFKVVSPISYGAKWLLTSEIFCFVLSNYYLFKKVQIRILPLKKLDLKVVKKYKDFPLFHSTSLFIQFLISELPSLYFKSKGELDLLGFYSMGNKLFVQPCMLVGYSLHPVLVHKFNENINPRTLSKVFGLLALLSLLVLSIGKFLLADIVNILLGKRWLMGLEIYSIQLYMILSKFFMGTVLALMISQNKSSYLLYVRGGEFLLLTGLVFLADFPFLPTFVLVEIFFELLLVGLSFQLARSKKSTSALP